MRQKQRVFVEEYLKTWNATEAARRAGYPERSAASIGWENLRKPEIARAIRARLAATAMSADEALARLAEHARAEYAPFLGASGEVDLLHLIEAGKAHLIKGFKYSRTGDLIVEFFDVQHALIKILEHHESLDPAQAEHVVMMTLEEWKQEAQRRRQEAEQTAALFQDDNEEAGA